MPRPYKSISFTMLLSFQKVFFFNLLKYASFIQILPNDTASRSLFRKSVSCVVSLSLVPLVQTRIWSGSEYWCELNTGTSVWRQGVIEEDQKTSAVLRDEKSKDKRVKIFMTKKMTTVYDTQCFFKLNSIQLQFRFTLISYMECFVVFCRISLIWSKHNLVCLFSSDIFYHLVAIIAPLSLITAIIGIKVKKRTGLYLDRAAIAKKKIEGE